MKFTNAQLDELLSEYPPSIMADLLADLKEARMVLADCASELAEEINARYENTLQHPGMKRRYDRDMSTVLKAQELLK